MITSDAIKKQSENAYKQWAVQWRENAKENSKHKMKSISDFENIGVGKAVLCVANGYSFELEIETIKKHQGNVDIIACDKTMGHLLDHGITPTYVIVCDANVNYERYMKKWENQLQDTILFSNVCGNPKWADNGNWKDKYFVVNEDVLGSEKEFMAISGCKNVIPAGTNVSNCMVVFVTQSNNSGRRNVFGYDKILLIGYDYCWRPDGKYYAFNQDGDGKHNYMRHIYARNINNDLCFTSNNLAFSAQWLEKYISTFKLPVIQCSRESVLSVKNICKLDEQMQYSFRKGDSVLVREMVKNYKDLISRAKKIEAEILNIGRQHYYAHVGTL